MLPAARAFEPELCWSRPATTPTATTRSAAARSRRLRTRELARQRALGALGEPVGDVLEGGYDLDALAASVAATMEALADGGEPGSHPRGELVDKAAAQVGRHWDLG